MREFQSDREKPAGHIVVRDVGGGVTSMRYVGRDPETRYHPRPITAWRLLREAWRLGA